MKTVCWLQLSTQEQLAAFTVEVVRTWASAQSKRIHLNVASGASVRALLCQKLIYCVTVSRPLLSVGQLKGLLDLRLIWDDAALVPEA